MSLQSWKFRTLFLPRRRRVKTLAVGVGRLASAGAAAYAAGGDGGTASAVSLSLALVNEARLLLSDRHSATRQVARDAAVVAENAARLWRESGAAEYVDDALFAPENRSFWQWTAAYSGGATAGAVVGGPRGAAGRRGGRGARRRGVGAAQAGLLEEAPEEAALGAAAPPPPEETTAGPTVPGGGWANEPPCCVDCGDAHSTTDFIGSSCPRAADATVARAPPPGLERLCAPRSSASDDRSYRVVRLANGVTCALGTATYPADNAYKEYVATHGGSTNALTSGELTTFQFDVVDGAFEGALDRFGRFFSEPLLAESCVDREMHAVDAEHSKNLQDDGRRAYQVLRCPLPPTRSPTSRRGAWRRCASTASATRLEFWRDRYDPAIATACLVGPRSLEDLEELCLATFGAMAKRGAFEAAPEAAPLFPPIARVHERRPVRDLRSLRASGPRLWAARAYWNGRRSASSRTLGHEGPNSLLASLKREGLAHGLSTADHAPADALVGGRTGLAAARGDGWSPPRAALVATLLDALRDPSRIVVHVATRTRGAGPASPTWRRSGGTASSTRGATCPTASSPLRAAVARGRAVDPADLGAPAPNPFLPDPARLKNEIFAFADDAGRRAASARPPACFADGGLACWWKTDAIFGQPKAYVTALERPLYDATCSGLGYDVGAAWAKGCVDVDVSGLAGDGLRRLLDAAPRASRTSSPTRRVRPLPEKLARHLRNLDKGRADAHAARWKRELLQERTPALATSAAPSTRRRATTPRTRGAPRRGVSSTRTAPSTRPTRALREGGEQLGYLVSARYASTRGRLHVVLTVQSKTADPPALRDASTRSRRVDAASVDLERAKDALATKWTEPDDSMYREASRFWGEVDHPAPEGPLFDRADRVAARVRAVTRDELAAFHAGLLSDDRRCLDVMCFGKGQDAAVADPDLADAPFHDAPPRPAAVA
ncbi:hypothetical protein JL720_15375 [Aureococcus anophagefferens]|nr:hypothetical protein JL720_15375 [Aureococcus anophagefferens]